jgi:hypothetical protein
MYEFVLLKKVLTSVNPCFGRITIPLETILNLSFCLISLDLIENSGAIFVIENVYQEQKLKDRLIDKNISIEDFGTYFQISRD